jgi:hypothetical protein
MQFLNVVKFATLVVIGVVNGWLVLAVYRKVRRIMTTEKNLQDTLDAIKDGVATVVDKLTAQAKTIADLTAQIAAGTPVTQDQLDALGTEATGIASALAAAVAPPTPLTAEATHGLSVAPDAPAPDAPVTSSGLSS